MKHQLDNVNFGDHEQWLVQKKSLCNIIDACDKVFFTGVAVDYIQSRLYNIQCNQQGFKSMKFRAERHSDEIKLFKDLNRIDRSRANTLQKKLDERVALARSQFKKCSFRVSDFLKTIITPKSHFLAAFSKNHSGCGCYWRNWTTGPKGMGSNRIGHQKSHQEKTK